MENSIRSIMEYLCASLAFEKITFSKARSASESGADILRAVVTLFEKRGTPYMQIETFLSDGKALHRNIAAAEVAEVLCGMAEGQYKQTNVHTADGDCEIRFSKKEQCHIANGIRPTAEIPPVTGADAVVPVRVTRPLTAHNKQRRYLLESEDGTAPQFLYALGITDEGGRILDKKRAKYRQINRFLELIDDIYDTLPREGTLTVCDLCCGKSYLTFAVYYYFTEIKKREIAMHGVDLKPDVIAYCNDTAVQLGFSCLTFSCGDINVYQPEKTPDLVISLHACDIATDIVLKNAAKWGTRAILSTPCCHHEVFHAMRTEPLSFITDYSMLGQKLADATTDALRCLWLELHDYDVQVLELIDPEETPKNLMLRAKKRRHSRTDAEKAALQAKADGACTLLGCRPYLYKE